jgi:hypothetical protein
MGRPRFRLRTLTIVVVVMAVIFATITNVSRWSDRAKADLYAKISFHIFGLILGGLGKSFENWWNKRRARRRNASTKVHPMWDSWNDGIPG